MDKCKVGLVFRVCNEGFRVQALDFDWYFLFCKLGIKSFLFQLFWKTSICSHTLKTFAQVELEDQIARKIHYFWRPDSRKITHCESWWKYVSCATHSIMNRRNTVFYVTILGCFLEELSCFCSRLFQFFKLFAWNKLQAYMLDTYGIVVLIKHMYVSGSPGRQLSTVGWLRWNLFSENNWLFYAQVFEFCSWVPVRNFCFIEPNRSVSNH